MDSTTDDSDSIRLKFDIGPQDLVRLLRKLNKAKTGPFAFLQPTGEGAMGLYLDVRRATRDGFECNVNTIHYRKPGRSLFAMEGVHAFTLLGTKVRDGETLVLIKRQDPRVTPSMLARFHEEMDRLREELAIPVPAVSWPLPEPVISEGPRQQAESIPPAAAPDAAGQLAEADRALDAVDRKIIEVVAQLERSGVRATDELVATRLPRNPKTDLSYHRVSVNKRRCKLRDKGYKV